MIDVHCYESSSELVIQRSRGGRLAENAGPLNLWRSLSPYHTVRRRVTATIVFPARPCSGKLRITLMNATQMIAMMFITVLDRPRCQGPCGLLPVAILLRSLK